MAYCLNPACKNPDNPDTNRCCNGCGLLLAESSKSYLFLHYKITKKLGQGAFGQTYLAEDTHLMNEPRVIKKLITTGIGSQSAKVKELFEREADGLYQLKHPQIPKLYAYFEQDNCLYLVQEYIEGQDLLSEWEQQGNFSEAKIEQGLQDLLPVLDYIHQNKVLHRDIKPENIMRRSSDRKLMLIDFGGAKQTTENLQSSPGTKLYTPGYAAWEQMSGYPEEASDIYSLGITMVRLLTGCFPDFDKHSKIKDPLYNKKNGLWLWRDYVQQRGIKINAHLAQVLDRMIEHFIDNRCKSAIEVLTILNSTSQPKIRPPHLQPIRKLTPRSRHLSTTTTQTSLEKISPQANRSRKINRSTPPIKNFFNWIGWGSVGEDYAQKQQKIPSSLNSAAQSKLKSQRQSIPKPAPLPRKPKGKIIQNHGSVAQTSWKTFSFEVVTVNSRAKIIKRETKLAKYLTAKLGNEVTMDFVSIPDGRFLMGSPDTEKGRYDRESPQRWVKVPPFLMGKYQVTQAQWQAVMGNNPACFKGKNRPVERVSWHDCVEFCNRLSLIIGRECRLPSEAEWEYACCAGTTTPFYFGNTIATDLVNYDGNYTYADEPKGVCRKETTPVGQFPPNAFGLYDMHGNVWEWCADTWHKNYQGAPTDGRAWLKKGDSKRSHLRGGSWLDNPYSCRSANRGDGVSRDFIGNLVGFRVICEIDRT